MSNEYNDRIFESLAEEVLEEMPDISDADLEKEVNKRFDALPEPDFDAFLEEEEEEEGGE